MAKQEREPDNLDEDRRWELSEEGYCHLDFAERLAKNRLSWDLARTKGWLRAYYHGTRFSHSEAYMLCGAGRFWPEFCYHPTESGYVLKFESLNSTTSDDGRPEQFEIWVDENRQTISRLASDGLGFNWVEIETLNS